MIENQIESVTESQKINTVRITKRDIFSPQFLEIIFLSLLLKGQFHEESFQTETVGR